MSYPSVSAEVGVSYAAGDDFVLRIVFSEPPLNLSTNVSISVDIFRIEEARNEYAVGFGASGILNGAVLTFSQKLRSEMKAGIHVVGAIRVNTSDAQQHVVSFAPVFFEIRAIDAKPLDAEAIASELRRLEVARAGYEQREMRTELALQGAPGRTFRVLVFGIGCLVHSPQPLEGFRIVPIGKGVSYGGMLSVVNHALWGLGMKQLTLDANLNQQHEQSTPTFFIEYFRVLGADHIDALEHCRRHADLVFDLLGLDRGQKPREFCSIGHDLESPQMWYSYSFPGYKGNLVSDFNPVATAHLIETSTPKLQRDPFLRLLVRSYAEATSEDDQGIALLRAWTVLELLADRAVPPGVALTHVEDGSPITKANGNPKDTNSKEGRVYELLRTSGTAFPHHHSWNVNGVQQTFAILGNVPNNSSDPGLKVIRLWDLVSAAYAIRNRVAHEGYFSVDAIDTSKPEELIAADFIKNTPIDPRNWIRDQAQIAVRRELHKT